MFLKYLIPFILGLACSSLHAQNNEQRLALVIGNSAYKSSPLKNPVNDARDMANSLRSYGFTVIERTNLTTRQVGQTLREFRSKLTPGSVAVFFYAGHGIQIKGENYLPTVDAEISGEEDVPMQSISTKQVMDLLAEAKTRMNLVFLDACRDNPYSRGFRSGSRGIAKENAPSGTLISFATRPGSVASDGDGRNGLYTSVLLEQMKQSNQPIEQVLKRVVSGVKTASKGQQEPWMEGSIEGDFCFQNCVASQPIANSTSTLGSSAQQREDIYWQEVKHAGNRDAYLAYMERYPTGTYAALARAWLSKLDVSRSDTVALTDRLTDQNKTKSASVASLELATTQFLRRIFADWSTDDQKAIALIQDMYAEKVNFYGVERSKDTITREKMAQIRRWPSRQYVLRDQSISSNCNIELKQCDVRLQVDWSVFSSVREARARGLTEMEMKIDLGNTRPLVISENGRTLSRAP
jgi:hypothetical protein